MRVSRGFGGKKMTLEKLESMLLDVFNGYESEIAREVRESLEAQQMAEREVEEVADAMS
jgi:hypothetical protein